MTSSKSPEPLLPGFNPDPSITRAGDAYYMVTSTFEYLPGIPVYRSHDLAVWEQLGNVITRPEQANLSSTSTPGGVWAPTIRYRNGTYYVIVTLMFGSDHCVLYTAEAPEGPWSDGTPIPAVTGIDPDLVWDSEGQALVSYSVMGQGIFQVAVDLDTGRALEQPRSLWSGTMHAPEGPHIHHHDGWWYLLIAEGGTQRGHAVSIARGKSARGPFEPCPANPVLTARSTNQLVQNVGHADMVKRPDGSTFWTVLGVRPVGFPRAFSPLGRETFAAEVSWVDGWPTARLVDSDLTGGALVPEVYDFSDPAAFSDPGWLSDRRLPSTVGSVEQGSGELVLRGEGTDLTEAGTPMTGRRQKTHNCTVAATVDVTEGIGGLVLRHSETHWVALEASTRAGSTELLVRASLSGFEKTWSSIIEGNELRLTAKFSTPAGYAVGSGIPKISGDLITLSAETATEHIDLVELDGRYWSFETTETFTGRVVGVYAREGDVRVRKFEMIPAIT